MEGQKVVTTSIVAALLKDAHLVAEFGSRTGLLGDSVLFESIQTVEASLEKGREEGGGIAILQKAMNDAIREIRPVTLNDLRSDRNPFKIGGKPSFRRHASRYLFVALATVLIIFSAHYLFWIKDAEQARIERGKSKETMQHALLVDLYDQLRGLLPISNQLLTIPNSEFNSAVNMARTSLRDKINEVTILTQGIAADKAELTRLSLATFPFRNTYDRIVRWIFVTDKKAKPKEEGESSNNKKPEKNGTFDTGSTAEFECLDFLRQAKRTYRDKNDNFADWDKWSNVDTFQGQENYQIAFTKCITGVQELERLASASSLGGYLFITDALNVTQNRIRLLEGWVLPALFGALGAVIYHLRICLNPLQPDPGLGQALMRVFLGGFAGISFGWFVSPTTTSEFLGRTLPLGAYTIAFLIGYSIDVFYALLDKAVALMSVWIERIGTGKAGKG